MSALTAGRELDAQVAEKVMGWTVVRDAWDTRSQDERTPRYDFGIRRENGVVDASVPPFSRSIDAAWQVVERVRQTIPKQTQTQTFSFQLCQSGIPGGWFCSFVVNDGDWSTQATVDEADTAPLAICLAALKACP